MARVDRWSRSSSHNVRRLASEGIRPRLPWASRFKPFVDDPEPVVQVIDRLIDDPSLYVRTTVANKSTTARDVVVDYQIHFRRSDGTLRPTTFKLGRVTVRLRASLRAPS